ncbi:MAG TPA: pilus assembly protein PilM [Solirubrobacteraceae bacterium]|nr:pilus assembly protein PilM [Solirubrobacteraceae bacterium]
MPRSPKNKRPIVGLDIEPGAVAAAQVEPGAPLTVAVAATAALPPNVVRDGEVADIDALASVLKEMFKEHKLDRRVRVGVANQRIVVRTLEIPPVEDRSEMEAAVRFLAQDELPMPLDEAVIDFHPLGIVDTDDGPRQRVVLVAARRQMIEQVAAAIRAAGLRAEGIDLSAFAMVRALGGDDPAPTLFLSIGGLSNLAIAEAGTVHFTRVSGSGLEGMAGILAERRQFPVEEARRLLVAVGLDGEIEPGTEEEAGMARSVLAEGVRRIAQEARASLDFHEGAASGTPIVERVVLTGAVVGIPGFLDALADELGLPVTPGFVAGGLSDAHGARFAVAAGLAVEEAQAA